MQKWAYLKATSNIYLLITGELKSADITKFWYDGYIINKTVYTNFGESFKKYPAFFFEYPKIDYETLDSKTSCIIMTPRVGSFGFNYTTVNCYEEKAHFLCRKRPIDCSKLDPTTRRKRNVDATLDRFFVLKEKLQHKNQAKQLQAAYKKNFEKMDMKKIYPKLFEILWYVLLINCL